LKKIAIITTHPIQYNAPFFKLLSERKKVDVKVFYTWGDSVMESKYDPDFKRVINWDVPLLEGYNYTFVKNISSHKGSHHFKGIINPTLIQEVKEWHADAILFFGWNFHSHFKAMRYFKGKIPVLFRGDSTLLDNKKNSKALLRKLVLRFVYSYVDAAFYVGTNNKNYFKKYGLNDKQLIFAPHAVDNDRFFNDKNGQEGLQWRNILSIPEDDFVFVFAGKFESKKNPELLIRAFKKLTYNNIHLVLTGNGNLESYLKNKYSYTKNIHFIDFQNQSKMPGIYNLADVFVLPSKGPGETWGLAVNEAMACGRAVLVSDKSGCAIDLVQNGKNGYIFISEDLEDLYKKMKTLIAERDYVAQMGKVSKDLIKKWNYSLIAEAIENEVITYKQLTSAP